MLFRWEMDGDVIVIVLQVFASIHMDNKILK